MKLAGVVILYHPGHEVIQNIQSYLNILDKLYVFDNTETNDKALAGRIGFLEKTVYLHDGENKGIASCLNTAAKTAIGEGYGFLLTMDQDSYFTPDNINTYITCLSSFDKKENVAMFGIQYLGQNPESNICSPRQTEKLITSGSFVNLSQFELIGGFDENLFIDEVDLEFCYRSIKKGKIIIQFDNVFLEHSLGQTSYHKSLKNFKLTPRVLHSPIRMYYMTRNYFYLNHRYKNLFSQDTARRKKSLLNRIKNNILYGKQKIKTIKYIIKAVIDYKKNKMGKIKNSRTYLSENGHRKNTLRF